MFADQTLTIENINDFRSMSDNDNLHSMRLQSYFATGTNKTPLYSHS